MHGEASLLARFTTRRPSTERRLAASSPRPSPPRQLAPRLLATKVCPSRLRFAPGNTRGKAQEPWAKLHWGGSAGSERACAPHREPGTLEPRGRRCAVPSGGAPHVRSMWRPRAFAQRAPVPMTRSVATLDDAGCPGARRRRPWRQGSAGLVRVRGAPRSRSTDGAASRRAGWARPDWVQTCPVPMRGEASLLARSPLVDQEPRLASAHALPLVSSPPNLLVPGGLPMFFALCPGEYPGQSAKTMGKVACGVATSGGDARWGWARCVCGAAAKGGATRQGCARCVCGRVRGRVCGERTSRRPCCRGS
jgi:hypothetical protein